jgi:hypothetical protein
MKKEINLEKIIDKYLYLLAFLSSIQGCETCKRLMKETVGLALDLAAEDALVTFIVDEEQDIVQEAYINKDSILQIKD